MPWRRRKCVLFATPSTRAVGEFALFSGEFAITRFSPSDLRPAERPFAASRT
jgi:hypothetical protein